MDWTNVLSYFSEMARPPGTRNADFERTRAELVRRVRARVLQPDGARVSFRELASAAGVGTTTLRHYFGTRNGALRAVLDDTHAEGAQYLLVVTKAPTQPLRESLSALCSLVLLGMQRGVGVVHAFGLAAGLQEPELGPAYLDRVLEPTLQAFEAHLAHHLARGALRADIDLRLAALQLLSPLLLAALHQHELGGAQCRPLALEAILAPHLDAWLRAWAASPAAPTSR
jgi:AcrR family transcriptional regulator